MVKTIRPSTGVWKRERAKSYLISFRWHGQRHTFAAFTDAKKSARLRMDTLRCLETHDAGEVIRANKLGKRCRQILVDMGVVEPPSSTDPTELASRYIAILRAKDDTPDYVARIESRLRKLIKSCKLRQISDLKAEPIENFVGSIVGTTATRNHYLRCAKSWSKWLFENEITQVDRLARLHLGNAEKDRKIRRRHMTDSEFDKLIEHTTVDGKILSAEARRLIYRLARYSGLRASEIASLTKHSLNRNTLVVLAKNTKNKREAHQPIPSWLAEEFREYAKESVGRVFPGRWHRRAAEMLYRDLAHTDVKREDERGYRVDFHALRHSYITGLALSGVEAKDAQLLARHSTITLTMQIYTHLDDQKRLAGIVQGAIPRMPRRMPSDHTRVHESARDEDNERVA